MLEESAAPEGDSFPGMELVATASPEMNGELVPVGGSERFDTT